MKQHNIFYFEKFEFDKENLVAKFYYNFDSELFFEEKIDFKDVNFSVRKDLDDDIINNILFSIHIVLGISYYKFYPTKTLILKTGVLDEFQINFWKKFYLNGLGEFFYRNKLDPKGLLNFESPYPSLSPQGRKEFSVSNKALVPVGGGKDSIVSIELLKQNGFEFDLFTFSSKDNILYENTTTNSGKNRLFVKREISQNISEVIKAGYNNGHVPITGMIAFIMELTAYLYDYKYLILSNEKSANFGNTLCYGVEINHQWSKSLDFEKDFGEYVEKYISKEVKYFSILRPFYEIKIAEMFTKYAKKYFTSFSSCNTNFKILSKYEKNSYWCEKCPKCAFVYAILSAFLNKEELLTIFSHDLYEDENLVELFKELLGISSIKPFECVGTNEEVVYAMKKALRNYEGKLPYILEIFSEEVDKKMTEKMWVDLEKKLFDFSFNESIIPAEFRNIKI